MKHIKLAHMEHIELRHTEDMKAKRAHTNHEPGNLFIICRIFHTKHEYLDHTNMKPIDK